MLKYNIILLFALYMCLSAKEPPTITIPKQGVIVGKEISRSRVQKIIGYYGIPYAQAPTDDRRFSLPITDPLPSWEGIRNITDYLPACLQSGKDYLEEAKPFLELISYLNLTYHYQTSSEDCLYLNIFTPYGSPPPQGFATIIWFHPGNFTTGSPAMWNPHSLVYRNNVIIVTIAWRLSILGFFTTMDGEAPGNYGLFDQQAAMMWVKNNIKLFGGNPDNICLMGYGTGGVSVGLHMINENSREYFNKAIIMSANIMNPSIVKYPEEDKKLLDKLAHTFSCDRKPTSRLISCLKNANGNALIDVTVNINWRPLIDVGLSNNSNPFLSETPRNYFERGDFHKVPFLTGYTNMEDILSFSKKLENEFSSGNATNDNLQQLLTEFISNDNPPSNSSESVCLYNNFDTLIDSVNFFYGPAFGVINVDSLRKTIADFTTDKSYGSSTFLLANYVSKENNATFVYRFDTKPITTEAIQDMPEWIGVPHLYDLIYIWGMPYWPEFDGYNWEIRDKRVSDTIMSFWTNFAKYSDPDPTKKSFAIKWDLFTKENPKLLIIDSHFKMSNSTNLNYKAFQFWNEYYPKLLDMTKQCCNTTGEATHNWNFHYIYPTFFLSTVMLLSIFL